MCLLQRTWLTSKVVPYYPRKHFLGFYSFKIYLQLLRRHLPLNHRNFKRIFFMKLLDLALFYQLIFVWRLNYFLCSFQKLIFLDPFYQFLFFVYISFIFREFFFRALFFHFFCRALFVSCFFQHFSCRDFVREVDLYRFPPPMAGDAARAATAAGDPVNRTSMEPGIRVDPTWSATAVVIDR